MDSAKLSVLKNKFLAWTTKWATESNADSEEIQFSVRDMLNILRALGFQIRDNDICDPQEISALKNGKRGVRIIMSCLHSGERYFLEKPTELILGEGTSNEVSTVPEPKPNTEKIDSGLVTISYSDPIQSPSNEMVHFASQIANQICNKMMNEINIETDSSSNASLNSKIFLPNSSKEKTYVKDVRADTLEQLISRETSKEGLNINDESLNEFYTSVKRVHSDLAVAISRLEKLSLPKLRKTAVSTSFLNSNYRQSLRQSKVTNPRTPQNAHLSTRTKSSPDLFRNRPSVKSSKPKLLSVKTSEIRKSKSNEDLKKAKQLIETPSQVTLTSKLYAHVKSTIPKSTSLKRNK